MHSSPAWSAREPVASTRGSSACRFRGREDRRFARRDRRLLSAERPRCASVDDLPSWSSPCGRAGARRRCRPPAVSAARPERSRRPTVPPRRRGTRRATAPARHQAGPADAADRAEPVPVHRDRPRGRDRLRPRLGDDRGEALPDHQRLGRGRLRLRQRRPARPLLRHRHPPARRHRTRRPEPALPEPRRRQVPRRDRGVGPGLPRVLPRGRRRRHRQRRRPGRLPLQLRPERPLPQQRRRHVPDISKSAGIDRPNWSSGGAFLDYRRRRRPRPLRRQLRRLQAPRGRHLLRRPRPRRSASTATPG